MAVAALELELAPAVSVVAAWARVLVAAAQATMSAQIRQCRRAVVVEREAAEAERRVEQGQEPRSRVAAETVAEAEAVVVRDAAGAR